MQQQPAWLACIGPSHALRWGLLWRDCHASRQSTFPMVCWLIWGTSWNVPASGRRLNSHQCRPIPALLALLPGSAQARRCLLAGGDDYELCFCAPVEAAASVVAAGAAAGVTVHRIGRIGSNAGVRVIGLDGQQLQIQERGFDHFAN
jgi:hypothetical protein